MAPPRGRKGALEEQVRDVLVIMHFLVKGNSPAYAEQIRQSWDRESGHDIIKWISSEVGPRQKTLSLAGTIQVCERLASPERGMLQKHSSVFGRRRKVSTYTLSETPEGFGKVAKVMLGISPAVFLSSSYAKHCLEDVWIPELKRRLGQQSVGSEEVDWIMKHSPTAVMISLEKDFGMMPGEWSPLPRASSYDPFEAWAGACAIADLMSPQRSAMMRGGDNRMRFRVQMSIEGGEKAKLSGEGAVRLRPSDFPKGSHRPSGEEASP